MSKDENVPNLDKNSSQSEADDYAYDSKMKLADEEYLKKLESIRQLDAELEIIQLQLKETNQRIRIKWGAIGLGLVVIVGMATAAWYFSHRLFGCGLCDRNAPIMVATIIVPLVSITAITITFFIAAFRQIKDGDVEKIAQKVPGAALLAEGG